MIEELKRVRRKLYDSVKAYKVDFIVFFEAMDELDRLIAEMECNLDFISLGGDAPQCLINGKVEKI